MVEFAVLVPFVGADEVGNAEVEDEVEDRVEERDEDSPVVDGRHTLLVTVMVSNAVNHCEMTFVLMTVILVVAVEVE